MFDFNIGMALTWYIAFLLSTTVHEAAHALAAKLGGDPTASRQGLLTIDPTPHMKRSPYGMVLVPLVTLLMNSGQWCIGWASAPYDPAWEDRHPQRASLMAMAGPAANLLIAAGAVLALRFGLAFGYFEIASGRIVPAASEQALVESLILFLQQLYFLNILLMVFNLFPTPPLDGASVIMLFLPRHLARRYRLLMSNPNCNMLGLFVAWYAVGYVFEPVYRVIHGLAFGGM